MAYTNSAFDEQEGDTEGSNPMRYKEMSSKMKISVIGSGDFGRALAGRLAKAGYKVTIASRNPSRNR